MTSPNRYYLRGQAVVMAISLGELLSEARATGDLTSDDRKQFYHVEGAINDLIRYISSTNDESIDNECPEVYVDILADVEAFSSLIPEMDLIK